MKTLHITKETFQKEVLESRQKYGENLLPRAKRKSFLRRSWQSLSVYPEPQSARLKPVSLILQQSWRWFCALLLTKNLRSFFISIESKGYRKLVL